MTSFYIYPTIAASSDGQAIVSVTGALQNYVPTFSNSASLFGSSNLIFDGSSLTVLGDIVLGNQNSITLANNGTLEIDVSNQLGTANTLTFPANASGILSNNGSGELSWINDPTSGDVSGPGEVTLNNQITLFTNEFGNQITNSVVKIDSGALSEITSLKLTNNGTMQIDVADQGSATNTLTIPVNDTGILSNDGFGILSWVSPPAITSVTHATNNNIATFSGANSLQGESNLTFDDSTLAISGNLSLGNENGLTLTNNGTVIVDVNNLGASPQVLILPANDTGALSNDGVGNLSWDDTLVKHSSPLPGEISAGDIPTYSATDSIILTHGGGVNIESGNNLRKVKEISFSDSGALPPIPPVNIKPHLTSEPYIIYLPNNNSTGILKNDNSGVLEWGSVGNVTQNGLHIQNEHIATFDQNTGNVIQKSSAKISSTGNLSTTTIELKNNTARKFAFKIADDGNSTTSNNLIWPHTNTSGYLSNNGSGNLSWSVISQGDVVGPVSSTNNAIARYNLTTGKLIKNSSVLISNDDEITGVANISLDGASSGTLTIQAAAITNPNYTIILPESDSDGVLLNIGGTLSWNGNYVTGPVSATENNIAVYDGSSGKIIKNSLISISGSTVVAPALKLTNGGSLTFQIMQQNNLSYTYTFPAGNGAADTFLQTDSIGTLTWVANNGIIGPNSSTNNSIVRFDSDNGIDVKASNYHLSDAAEFTNTKSIELKNNDDRKITFKIADVGNPTTSNNLIWPNTNAAGYLTNNGSGSLSWTAVSQGDVVGPVSSIDNSIARFDQTTGKLIKDSSVLISNTAEITGVASIALDGSISGTLTIKAAATTTNYTITIPADQGDADTVLTHSGAGTYIWQQMPSIGLVNFTAHTTVGGSLSNQHSDSTLLHIICIGGGGGSRGTASGDNISVTSGGGSGRIMDVWIPMTSATFFPSVGAGGTAGNHNSSAGDGTESTFSALGSPIAIVAANGGEKGQATNDGKNITSAAKVAGGNGASDSNSNTLPNVIIVPRNTSMDGGYGLAYGGNGSLLISGKGGGVPGFSQGGKSQIGIIGTTADQDGIAGDSWGAGASGSCNATGSSNTNGAAGHSGLILVWEYAY